MAQNRPEEIGAYPRNPSQLGTTSTSSSGGSQAPITISTMSPESLGTWFLSGLSATGSATFTMQSFVWGTANQALFMPFVVNSLFVCANIWWVNAGTVAGNMDAGIYTAAGAKVATLGSTAQSGASAIQSAALSATLTPGQYYFALANSGTTATVYAAQLLANFNCAMTGMARMGTAEPLPATATFATASGLSDIPLIGITSRSVV